MEKYLTDWKDDCDKRMLVRKVLSGEISEENLEKYLSELPDVSSCAEEIMVE